jgi:transcriptional regulator with PAS, ATPase and Fis domain
LGGYSWPGNVRELYNVLERASVTGERDFTRLMAEHLALAIPPARDRPAALPDNLESAIRLHAQSVFEKYGGNLSKAAAALAVSRNTARKYLG